jgi:hypothetical protein
MTDQTSSNREALLTKLNSETGKIDWQWLKPHFKSGALIELSTECDLVEMAAFIAEDNSDRIRQAMADQLIRKPDAGDVDRWESEQAQFWSVVVAPFVLIQRIPSTH